MVFRSENFPPPVWFPVFVSIGLVTHIFRIWEYLSGKTSSFCGNRSLFVVNNLKFIGLLLILVWGLLITQ
jgi:hypothetical protein